MPTLRAASEKEIKYFKSDSYSPPEILPDDEWEDGTDFIDDYEPFWDERGEEEEEKEENLQEPLYKVRFSDDYLVEGAAAKQIQIVFKLEKRAKSDKVPQKPIKETSTRKGGAKSILSCAHMSKNTK